MKKLFFLCAFLFISTQIKAQLYMVATEAYAQPMNNNGSGEYSSYIYIYTPDGQEIIENLGYLSPENYSADWRTASSALHSVLNNIIAEGYKIATIHTGLDGNGGGFRWHEQTFYLTVP